MVFSILGHFLGSLFVDEMYGNDDVFEGENGIVYAVIKNSDIIVCPD